MAKTSSVVVALVLCVVLLAGCARGLHSEQERKMTVGLVQKEIRVGMDQAMVAAALGTPNIVSRTTEGKEAWIYDKIATEASYRDSSGNIIGGVEGAGMAGSVLLLGNVGGSHSRQKGRSATTQKTLTVIIRFDGQGLVESFSYHTSTF